MSTHCGYITTLKNVRPHPNANRLLLGECFGNTVCVSLKYTDGMIGVYFPVDLQLSEEFCRVNDLVRRKDEAGNPAGGYLDPDKRNIVAIKLRGEKSDGLFLPLYSLDYCFSNGAEKNLHEGDQIEILNGHEICCKYVPRHNPRRTSVSNKNKNPLLPKVDVAPLFAEHIDTEQLQYNLADFKPGDFVEITLKLHGTSGRTANLPVFSGFKIGNPFKKLVYKWLQSKDFGKLHQRERKLFAWTTRNAEPIYNNGYVSGTRRVILKSYDGGFYSNDEFRKIHAERLQGKIPAGFSVYYEIVGFTTDGTPIMGSCDNRKTKDKEFIKRYGNTTTFSYGCSPTGKKYFYTPDGIGGDEEGGATLEFDVSQSEMYVYRITTTSPDGDIVELMPWEIERYCEFWGVNKVPTFWIGRIPEDVEDAGAWVQTKAEEYYDGLDPVGRQHVREGVVVRILNRPKFAAYKHKNFAFKILAGIAIAQTEEAGTELSADIAEEM